MVWTHTPPQPAQHLADLGPWLGRVAARLRATLTPVPIWTEALAEAQHSRAGTFEPGAEAGAEAEPGVTGFTRVEPIHALPMAPPVAALPAADTGPAPTPAAAALAAIRAPVGAQFHSVAATDISVIFVLSRRFGPGLPCLEWLADHGLPFRRIAALTPTAPVWSAPADALLLVDLDTLGGIAVMAEALMRFRLTRPDVAVVLLSEEVGGHDFGTDRLALADITLRLPCAFASFEFALAEAPINNAEWQQRLMTVYP